MRRCAQAIAISFEDNRGMMFIRFVGTHRDYDGIDAATISGLKLPADVLMRGYGLKKAA